MSETERPESSGIGLSASNRIAEALSRSGLVRVVPAAESAHWRQALINEGFSEDNPSIMRATAERAGASLYVVGSYAPVGDSIHFWARVIDVKTGTLLRAIIPVIAPSETATDAIQTLHQRITGAVGTVVDPRFRSWTGAASLPHDLESYQRYSAAVDQFIAGRFDVAAEELQRAGGDPNFASPLIWTALARTRQWYGSEHFDDSKRDAALSLIASLEPVRNGLPAWDQAMLRYVEALLRIDFPGAHSAIREVVGVAPGAFWYMQLAQMCAWLDRPGELLDVLSRFDPNTGWLEASRRRYWSLTLWAHHRTGDYSRELEVVRSLKGSPNDEGRWLYSIEMRALVALHHDAEVLQEFDLLMASDNVSGPAGIHGELMAHGYTELGNRAAARVVEILDGSPTSDRDDDWKYFRASFLLNEHVEEARAQLEEIPPESPRYLDALGYLGELAAKRGERGEALRISAALEAIGQASLRYEYQAIIAAELGDRERAVSLLRLNESPPRGYMHREMGFPTLLDYPPFQELERPRG